MEPEQEEAVPDNVVPLRPPFDRHNLGVEADRLAHGIELNPGWVNALENKLQAFQWVQKHQKLVPEAQFQHLMHVMETALGWNRDRLARTLLIEKPAEIRRALMAKKVTLLRLPDEEIYPKTGWLGDYLLYAQNSEVPLGWHFWSAIGIIAGVARRNVYVDRSNHYIFPNHYILIVGRTGLKKSTAMVDTGIPVVRDLNELLKRHKEEEIRVIPPKITVERFLQMIKSVPRGFRASTLTHIRQEWSSSSALFSTDEMVTMFSKEAHHPGSMVQILTALYGCPEIFENSTIGRGEDVLKNVSITFMGGTTIEWLKSSMTEDAAHGGFLGRCIVAYRKEDGRFFPEADVLDPVLRGQLAERLVHIARCRDEMMDVQPAAKVLYEEMHHDFKQHIPEDTKLAGYYARKGAHCWKLAMVLGLAQERHFITLGDLELAHALINSEEIPQSTFYANLGGHQDADKADKVYQWIMAHSHSGHKIPFSEIFTKMRRIVGSEAALRGILDALVAGTPLKRIYDGRRKQDCYWVDRGVDRD